MRVFEVIDGLVTTFRGATGYGTPTERGVVPVFDGPVEVTPPDVYVVVGSRSLLADEDADDTTATTDAEWASVPVTAGSQYETASVPCVVGAWSGDGNGIPDWSSLRGLVADVVSDLETAVRTPAGIGVTKQVSVVFTGGTVRQVFAADGCAVEFTFDAEVRLIN